MWEYIARQMLQLGPCDLFPEDLREILQRTEQNLQMIKPDGELYSTQVIGLAVAIWQQQNAKE